MPHFSLSANISYRLLVYVWLNTKNGCFCLSSESFGRPSVVITWHTFCVTLNASYIFDTLHVGLVKMINVETHKLIYWNTQKSPKQPIPAHKKKLLEYLHYGLFVGQQVTKQGDICLTKRGLIRKGAAFSASFGQNHSFGNLAHLFQMFHPHLHEALALQADICIN